MNKLALLRKKRGLSQTELALMLGTHQPVVSDLERQKLQPNQLNTRTRTRLEAIFCRPLDDLLTPLTV